MIKRRDSIEDYYWNEHLPLGFFLNNGGDGGGGDGGGNAAPQQGPGLMGSGLTQPYARSGIPGKPKVNDSKNDLQYKAIQDMIFLVKVRTHVKVKQLC